MYTKRMARTLIRNQKSGVYKPANAKTMAATTRAPKGGTNRDQRRSRKTATASARQSTLISCAAERRPPSSEYFEFDEYPPSMIAYTFMALIAKMTRIPMFTLAIQ